MNTFALKFGVRTAQYIAVELFPKTLLNEKSSKKKYFFQVSIVEEIAEEQKI